MVTRALPLLLLFITFLFINTEVWQVAPTRWTAGVLWLAVLFFARSAVVFLLVRLPEEMDRVDDDVDPGRLRRAHRGAPRWSTAGRGLRGPRRRPARRRRGHRPAAVEPGPGAAGLQSVQVLLLSLSVLVFLLVFGCWS